MSSPYVGEIRMFGGNFAPAGWALCNGQTMSISENDVLFNLIGTTYGGDGQTTFNLPDLRSRVPIHQSSNDVIGATGGQETVTLTQAQIPSHSHQLLGTNNPTTSSVPTNNVLAATGQTPAYEAGAVPNRVLNSASLPAVGGSQPHSNIQPFLAINFIISLYGVYPSPT